MSRFARPCVVLVVVSLWWSVGPIAETEAGFQAEATQPVPTVEMQPGQSYPAGTRVQIPKGSASFIISAGWHAQVPEDSETIIAESESGAGFVMVFMVLDLTDEELIALLGEPQPITHDLVFEPDGQVVRKGNRLAASYRAGALVGRAVIVMGPNQQGVLFFLGRPPTESNQPDRVLDDLADSTEFAPAK